MTKPITSTAAMILIEDGPVSLEDQISSHIEDLPPFEIFDEFDFVSGSFTTERASNEVTIKQLLTHTSGLAYNFRWLHPSMLSLRYAITALRPRSTKRSNSLPYTAARLTFSDSVWGEITVE